MSPAAPVLTVLREPGKLVMDILQEEMDLDEAHCLQGNQKWDIPPDGQLFVVIFDAAGPTIASTSFLDTDETSPTVGLEIQESSVLHDVRIEIMSLGTNEARQRKEEPGLALNSFLAQQLAARYHSSIGRAQTPVDASESEVTGRLQKFAMHVNVTALHRKVKTKPALYFDKFNKAITNGTALPPETTIQP